jgi:hypothetical protein
MERLRNEEHNRHISDQGSFIFSPPSSLQSGSSGSQDAFARSWEQLLERGLELFAPKVRGTYLKIEPEFGKDLAARTARTYGRIRVRDDCDLYELSLASGDCGEDGVAFGTDGQAKGKVFDVAAGEDAAGTRQQRCANGEFGVGGVGFLAGFSGLGEERFEVHKVIGLD